MQRSQVPEGARGFNPREEVPIEDLQQVSPAASVLGCKFNSSRKADEPFQGNFSQS
jgi:hypothetical protein